MSGIDFKARENRFKWLCPFCFFIGTEGRRAAVYYEAVQICNNNVVLARKPSGEQVVIVGKGVGFGLHKGAHIDDANPNNRVFSILDGSVDLGNMKRLDYDVEKLEKITRDIVSAAEELLGIKNEKLFDALFDHIVFAVERLKIGLPIDNPFITEISVMCTREFDIAELAAKLIREELDVDIGEAERGFIALHLYSAQGDRHISAAIKDARVYQDVLTAVCHIYGVTPEKSSSACRGFLMTLNHLVSSAVHGAALELPVKQQVRTTMNSYYHAAEQLNVLLQKQLGVKLSDDALAYLAVAINLLVQL